MPTIKELHNKIRQYNASNCINGYSKKKRQHWCRLSAN